MIRFGTHAQVRRPGCGRIGLESTPNRGTFGTEPVPRATGHLTQRTREHVIRMNSAPPPQCIFICSAGHSGSTLLDMLIGSHPQCESLGEVVLLPMEFALDRVCTCGSQIRECPLWSDVARRLGVDPVHDPYGLNLGYLSIKFGDPRLKTPWAVARMRLGYALAYYRHLHDVAIPRRLVGRFDDGIRNTLQLFDTVRSVTHKQVVVDSSKHHTRAVALYRSRPDSVRVVLLVRDGRGVFFSSLKAGLSRSYSLNSWRRHYVHALPLLTKRVKPEHMLFVRYEHLVQNPAHTLSQICDFAEIPYDEAMLKFRAVPHHNVNGNQSKFRSGDTIRLDEAWKSGLSKRDAAYFERKAGDLNRQFGYQD